MSFTKLSLTLALLTVTACSKSEPAMSDSAAITPGNMSATPAAGGSMAGGSMAGGSMAGGAMAGGGMAMGDAHSDSVAAYAQTHLDSLVAASPEGAVKMVPEYKQSITALLADCEQMMKKMKMTPPAKWNTAAGAVRADLAKMSGASASALHAMVPAHAERVKGILGMRHDMMKM